MKRTIAAASDDYGGDQIILVLWFGSDRPWLDCSRISPYGNPYPGEYPDDLHVQSSSYFRLDDDVYYVVDELIYTPNRDETPTLWLAVRLDAETLADFEEDHEPSNYDGHPATWRELQPVASWTRVNGLALIGRPAR